MDDELESEPQSGGDGSPLVEEKISGTPAGKVEPEGSGHEGNVSGNGTGQPNNGRNRYFAGQRYERKIDQRFGKIEDALGQVLEALKPKPQTPSSVNSSPETFWSNPIGTMDQRLQSEREMIRKEISEVVAQNLQRYTVEQKAQLANQYLATLGEFSDEDFLEMREIAQEVGLDYSRNPQRAALAVFKLWQEEKGISSKSPPGGVNNANPKPSKAQVAGIKGGANAGPAKVWTKEEIKETVKDPEKYEKFRSEIRSAYREGRVK